MRPPGAPRTATDPAALALAELIATKPRYHRGSLAPGERFPTGMRPGRRRAQGVDLDSIGPYVPGDDIRAMDWSATARTGRAQMKRFVAESHLARMLVIDMRPPMFFATAGHPLAKTAALLAARAGWQALSLHEAVGMLIVPANDLVRPRRGRRHVLGLLDRLVESYAELSRRREPVGNEALAVALETAAASLSQGDAIDVFSEFGGPLAPLVEGARRLAGARSLHAVVLEDAILSRPVARGRYPLQGPGDPERRLAVVRSADNHAEVARTLRRTLRRELTGAGFRIDEVSAARLVPEPAS